MRKGNSLRLTSPVRSVPEELERSMVFVELRSPDEVELASFPHEEKPDAPPALLPQFARALKGLTLDEDPLRPPPRSRR